MNELEKYILGVYDKLSSGQYAIETLGDCDPEFRQKSEMYIKYISNTDKINLDVLHKFVIIQLDYYTFSNIGDVFISDSDYDIAVCILKKHGINAPTTSTFQPTTKTWPIKQHTAPQMVGSVEKVFDLDSVHEFLNKHLGGLFGETVINVAPKYDGIGINIEYDPTLMDFTSALTRKDGMYGQELIKVIKNCSNYEDELVKAVDIFGSAHGYIKAEIVLSQSNFEAVNKERVNNHEKTYSNRRNGTAGIVNTPSNFEYTKYLTIKHLVYATEKSRKKFSYYYDPDGCEEIYVDDYMRNPSIIDKFIDNVLTDTHVSSFEYRTDGVVIFISNLHLKYENVMDHSVAFKTNSKVGVTRIKNGYISIGRTGKATPMIKVEPCDVNETIVTDVSLSNFAKVKKLDLHEGDMISIESSGDVIPMVKEVIKQGSMYSLEFDLHCPMCGKMLHREASSKTESSGVWEYRCINNECPAVKTGVITNFFDKLGANGISDTLILNVHERLGLNSIADFLDTSKYKEDLMNLSGWGTTSALNFTNEIDRIKEKPISNGEFIGALGIPLISTKKCRNIFATIKYDKFINYIKEGKFDRADDMLYSVSGLAKKSVDTIMQFFQDNYEQIEEIRSYFKNVTNDRLFDANVVFTGFRDSEAEKEFLAHGIDVSNNVNSKTIAVISADRNSGKTRAAQREGIPIYDAYDLQRAIFDITGK